ECGGSAGRVKGAAPEAGVCWLLREPGPVFEATAWHLCPAGPGSPHLGLSGPREAALGQISRGGSGPQAPPTPVTRIEVRGWRAERGRRLQKRTRQGRKTLPKKTEELFPAGQFVRLEFKLQQTSCRKKDWRKEDCKVKPNGRKRKCLACIKLDSKDQVLGRMVHCPIQTQVQRELDDAQDAQCSRVERAGEDPHSYYLPGQFAFIKALSP
uniref:Retinoic acid receptor responder protein 2 n=1 Tax=Bos taurus TaxID=9913 RepID=A0AAF6YM65_BOVIN